MKFLIYFTAVLIAAATAQKGFVVKNVQDPAVVQNGEVTDERVQRVGVVGAEEVDSVVPVAVEQDQVPENAVVQGRGLYTPYRNTYQPNVVSNQIYQPAGVYNQAVGSQNVYQQGVSNVKSTVYNTQPQYTSGNVQQSVYSQKTQKTKKNKYPSTYQTTYQNVPSSQLYGQQQKVVTGVQQSNVYENNVVNQYNQVPVVQQGLKQVDRNVYSSNQVNRQQNVVGVQQSPIVPGSTYVKNVQPVQSAYPSVVSGVNQINSGKYVYNQGVQSSLGQQNVLGVRSQSPYVSGVNSVKKVQSDESQSVPVSEIVSEVEENQKVDNVRRYQSGLSGLSQVKKVKTPVQSIISQSSVSEEVENQNVDNVRRYQSGLSSGVSKVKKVKTPVANTQQSYLGHSILSQGQKVYKPASAHKSTVYQSNVHSTVNSVPVTRPLSSIKSELGDGVLRRTQTVKEDGTYEFGYETVDGQQRHEQTVLKNIPGGVAPSVSGSYDYISPEGVPVHVTYISDEYGYRAESDVIPKTPVEILRALEYIKKTKNLDDGSYHYHDHDRSVLRPVRPVGVNTIHRQSLLVPSETLRLQPAYQPTYQPAYQPAYQQGVLVPEQPKLYTGKVYYKAPRTLEETESVVDENVSEEVDDSESQ